MPSKYIPAENPPLKNCVSCGREFQPSKNDSRIIYCGEECRLSYREKKKYNSEWSRKNREHVNDYREKTKDKRNARRRELYANEPERREKAKQNTKGYREKNPNARRNNDLVTKFGITLDDYNKMLEEQNGGCAICGAKENIDSKFSLHVDHSHKTGVVRGILCSSCNLGLGKFKDDPDLLIKASEYLRRFF